MAKTVLGGKVYRNNQDASLAVAVEKIEFPLLAPGANVAVNDSGTMYLKGGPSVIGHYDRGDVLLYQDSNRHNDITLTVDSNIGPAKYQVTVQGLA